MDAKDLSHITFDPDTKLIKTVDKRDAMYPGGLGKLSYDRMKLNAQKNKIAQVDTETGKEYSTKNLFDRCENFATFFKDIGIEPGDIVMICTYSSPDSCVPLIAASWIGAIVCSTDPIIGLENQIYFINLTKPKAVIVSAGSEELMETAIKRSNLEIKLIPFCSYKQYDNYNEIQKRYSSKNTSTFEPYFSEDLDETILILFSSGTTSLPKAIALGHRYLLVQLNVEPVFDNFRVSVMAGSYWFSRVALIFVACIEGAVQIILRKVDPTTIWDIIEEFKIHGLFLPNSLAIESVQYLNRDIKHLAMFSAIGGPVPENCLKIIEDKLPNTIILLAYGTTETGMITTALFENKPLASCGIPIPNGQILKVVNTETNKALGFNEVGELLVKSMYTMNGYYNESTEDCRDDEGFMRTGDLVYYNEEFFFFIVGRNKETFKFRSFQISPLKLETVLLQHPDVYYAAVIGVPHPIDEHHPKAFVALKENSSVSNEELLKFANERLDHVYQIRAGIQILHLKDFPVTTNGKIQKLRLQSMFC